MANNIIDKIQISGQSYDVKDSSAATVVELTQQEYDDLPSSAKTGNTLFVITDAEAGDLTNYYTKTETNTLLNGKQATLVSGTNIKTINNESLLGSGNIDIQGGSTYSGVSGVTINNNNEIYYDGIYKTWLTSNHSNDYAVYWFRGKNAKIWISDSAPTSSNMSYLRKQFSFGGANNLGSSNGSVAFGQGIDISGFYASSFGQYNYSKNQVEFSVGQYNTSSSASTTFGDSGNTLFSVGNGTADNARHNAFEIRQNGDIYITSGGTDIKLQDNLGGSNVPESRLNFLYGYGTSGGTDVFSWSTGSTSQIINDYVAFSKINNTSIMSGKNASPTNFSLIETSAITTAITSSSTDAQVPSAKAVYDIVGDIETLLSQI